jgi:hypothetical protein
MARETLTKRSPGRWIVNRTPFAFEPAGFGPEIEVVKFAMSLILKAKGNLKYYLAPFAMIDI